MSFKRITDSIRPVSGAYVIAASDTWKERFSLFKQPTSNAGCVCFCGSVPHIFLQLKCCCVVWVCSALVSRFIADEALTLH